jgi:MEDS: MEthanogen/methylotroph, DcmR Sensory domain
VAFPLGEQAGRGSNTARPNGRPEAAEKQRGQWGRSRLNSEEGPRSLEPVHARRGSHAGTVAAGWTTALVCSRRGRGGEDADDRAPLMRRHLSSCDASGFCLHDHVAWRGDGPELLGRLAVSAFSTAARRGERMVFVSERPDPRQLAGLADLEALLRDGTLELVPLEYAYGTGLAGRLALFEQLVDQALADGTPGICVVADNSSLVLGNDEDFASWLAWEAMADKLEATRPVTGICYFDQRVVPNERIADLAAVHPVLSPGFEEPSFQLFFDEGALQAVGTLDRFCLERLRRALTSRPNFPELLLDIKGTEFMDHRTLLALNEMAGKGGRLRVRGAKAVVRRVWDLLDVPNPALEFV